MRHTITIAILVASIVPSIALAQPGYDKDPLSWDRVVHAKFSRFCFKCHGSNEPTADVDLAIDENPLLIRRNRDKWELVLEALKSGAMPPEDARELGDEDRELMIKFLDRTLGEVDCDGAGDPGRPVMRRLNRNEYDKAVVDLTGLDLKLSRNFPAETQAYGFDNIGEALTLTPLEVQQYHDAANTIVHELLASHDGDDARKRVYSQTFIAEPSDSLSPRDAAREVIVAFANRAFRRDADPAFIEGLLVAYDRALSEGADHETAVGYLLTGVLVSPRFLMLVEADQPDTDEPYPVDDFELATRLSFFLWSRPPDDELRQVAQQGKLRDDKMLRKQTLRMLADDRAIALVENFFSQWLGVNELDTFAPDPTTFPEFDDSLRRAMRDEVHLFLSEMVKENRPVTEIIDAKHIYLNERLARHYGLTEELSTSARTSNRPQSSQPESMRRVVLTESVRGGLLTSAAMLMLQSDPTRTNIPRRGNYIAGRILGAPPPPPPPNVPPLDQAGGDSKHLTLRERLDLHRSEPQCATCHSKIDPLGFALENFDAIGRWRDTENGAAIDASGELPGTIDLDGTDLDGTQLDATQFDGAAEMKTVLLQRKAEFRETFVKNLLVYALGRGINGGDVCLQRQVTEVAEASDDRFADVVWSIVQSDTFRKRRNAEY